MPTWLSGPLCWSPCTPPEGESRPPAPWGPEAAGICPCPRSLHPHLVEGGEEEEEGGWNHKNPLVNFPDYKKNKKERCDATPQEEKIKPSLLTSVSLIWLWLSQEALDASTRPNIPHQRLHSPPATFSSFFFFCLFIWLDGTSSSSSTTTTTTWSCSTYDSWLFSRGYRTEIIFKRQADAITGSSSSSSSRSHFAVNLELSCKTKRSSYHNNSTDGAQRRLFSSHQKPQSAAVKQRMSKGGEKKWEEPHRTAPRSADRWTMTRRSTKPAERLPCFPFSLMSGLCPACNTLLLHRSPSPYLRYCRTPITHQHQVSSRPRR